MYVYQSFPIDDLVMPLPECYAAFRDVDDWEWRRGYRTDYLKPEVKEWAIENQVTLEVGRTVETQNNTTSIEREWLRFDSTRSKLLFKLTWL